MLKDINSYMIVVKDSEASVYYSNYCITLWKEHLKDVTIYDAVTPQTLNKYKELKFAKYSAQLKYTKKNIKAEITQTEKACFQSHFNLWMECCFLQKPIVILEHDAFLKRPENLWYDDNYGIIFYDDAAMGSYVIQPWFARMLVEYCMNVTMEVGPYGTIHDFGIKNKLTKKIVSNNHHKFNPSSVQVMSKKYGSTVKHYVTLHPEHWPTDYNYKFTEID